MTVTDTRPFVGQPPPPAAAAGGARLRRVLRGRPGDGPWVRPSLLAVLAATAVLYTWTLDRSGWANSFYAAAVQAGTRSWKAFLFGSFDSSNFITVDKPPASLWVMELSARVFGLNSWSLLVPQAVEGVATVAMVYLVVRRVLAGRDRIAPVAALLAAAATAVTPVATLMFRYDNPDALLVLLLVVAAYATMRYLDDARRRWLVLAGALVGVAFLTKSLQAFLPVPALVGVVAVAGSRPLRRRLADLALGGLAMVVAGGWWLAVVALTPAADRPYVGGSQDNSEFNLIFGYNGFGRLTGNESGSVGGGGGGGGNWGPTGLTRLFNDAFGGQISWLLPAAVVLLVGGLVLTRRAARTDGVRAGLALWGGTLVVTGLVLSLSKGIIHPYYTVALAPAVAVLVAVGGALAWERRGDWPGRAWLAGAVGLTALWSWKLLDRSPAWHPWLRTAVLVVGLAAAVGLAVPWPRRAAPAPAAVVWGPDGWEPATVAGPVAPAPSRLRARVQAVAVVAAVAAALAGPLAYSVTTASAAESGAIPSAGPAVAGSFGGPGGFGAGRAGRFGGAGNPFAGGAGAPAGGQFPGGQVPGGRFPGGQVPGGGFPGAGAGGFPGGRTGAGRAGGGRGFGGGIGGLLGSTAPSAAVRSLLEQDASTYRWVAAITGAEQASGYQLATGDPVMAIGGFNGTDPTPTLAAFERDVAAGDIHWYIAGGGFGGRSGSGDAGQIATWVAAHYSARTVGGVTLYDLSPTA